MPHEVQSFAPDVSWSLTMLSKLFPKAIHPTGHRIERHRDLRRPLQYTVWCELETVPARMDFRLGDADGIVTGLFTAQVTERRAKSTTRLIQCDVICVRSATENLLQLELIARRDMGDRRHARVSEVCIQFLGAEARLTMRDDGRCVMVA
jgi:hypothetical protein